MPPRFTPDKPRKPKFRQREAEWKIDRPPAKPRPQEKLRGKPAPPVEQPAGTQGAIYDDED